MSHAIQQVMIRGRVQGVGYRAGVEHQARTSKLEGWVRNRRDGSVEALFAGPADIVSAMIAACRHGPAMARVGTVQEEEGGSNALTLRRVGERFSVLPTV